MEQFLSSLTARLSGSDRDRLLAVHAPRAVAIPPEDSRRAVVVMPDGEIRAYGTVGKKDVFDTGRQVYLSSGNCGLDFPKIIQTFHDVGYDDLFCTEVFQFGWCGNLCAHLRDRTGRHRSHADPDHPGSPDRYVPAGVL